MTLPPNGEARTAIAIICAVLFISWVIITTGHPSSPPPVLTTPCVCSCSVTTSPPVVVATPVAQP